MPACMRLLQVEVEGALVKLAVVFHRGTEAPLPPAVEAVTCWVPLVDVLRGCGLTEAGWEEDRGDAGIASATGADDLHHGCHQNTGRRRSRERIRRGGAGGDDALGHETVRRRGRHDSSGREADGSEEQCNSSSSSGGGSLDEPAPGQGTPSREGHVGTFPVTARPGGRSLDQLAPRQGALGDGEVAASQLTCQPEFARLRPLIPHILAAILAR